MREMKALTTAALLVASLVVAHAARADVTGSYDGNVTVKKPAQTIAAAGVLSQASTAVTGTIALPGDLATFGGQYLVVGKATPKRVKVSGGGPGGVFLTWRAKVVGGTLTGKAKVKGPGAKLTGTLVMTHNPPAGDGTSCDAVYDANQSLFVDQLMPQTLATCATCHGPGLQAADTRLRVNTSDPLATARSIAALVDASDAASTRVLQKPLNVVPHGGGVQLEAGTTPEQLLTQWVDLVIQAHCK